MHVNKRKMKALILLSFVMSVLRNLQFVCTIITDKRGEIVNMTEMTDADVICLSALAFSLQSKTQQQTEAGRWIAPKAYQAKEK